MDWTIQSSSPFNILLEIHRTLGGLVADLTVNLSIFFLKFLIHAFMKRVIQLSFNILLEIRKAKYVYVMPWRINFQYSS